MYEIDANSKLVTPPGWYSSRLPKFYISPSAGLYLRPLNTVKGYTDNDVLDCLLYLQTIVGYNRPDYRNARSVAVTDSNHKGMKEDISNAFISSPSGDGSGDFLYGISVLSGVYTDGALYTQLQQRYIQNESQRPWLAAMNAKGGDVNSKSQAGIDLMTIPAATDLEIPRPSWYTGYLPSLFMSAGMAFQYPAGHLDTKPKIRNYIASPNDVARLLVYLQPVVALGPSPYPVLWFVNDVVNGAEANYFKISLGIDNAGHNDAQEQLYGITGDMMTLPKLDADPYASGFTHLLQTIVSTAVSYFTTKIPGGTTLTTAANTAAKLGGAGLTAGMSPEGTFSAAVYAAADALSQSLNDADRKKLLLLGGAGALLLLFVAWDEGYI